MTGLQRREEVIIAGFGGQGVILAGKLLAQIAMQGGNEVTFIPSYGAEMRGGTANCSVIIARTVCSGTGPIPAVIFSGSKG